jgi:hypothetical protein
VGEYKESLPRSCIKKFLPKRYTVGTGFIVFIKNRPIKYLDPNNIDIINLKSHSI